MQTRKGFSASSVVLIVAALVLVAGIGYYASRSSPQEEKTPNSKTGDQSTGDEHMMDEDKMMKDEAMTEKDTMMEKGDNMMTKYAGKVLAGKSAPLLDYNKADYDAAIVSDKLVVLYFYANWCPICKEETVNALYPAFNELTTEKVIGIRINYNDSDTDQTEKELAKQFGVAYQHTKVFVKNGNRILKSPEGWDKNRYLSEINKAI